MVCDGAHRLPYRHYGKPLGKDYRGLKNTRENFDSLVVAQSSPDKETEKEGKRERGVSV